MSLAGVGLSYLFFCFRLLCERIYKVISLSKVLSKLVGVFHIRLLEPLGAGLTASARLEFGVWGPELVLFVSGHHGLHVYITCSNESQSSICRAAFFSDVDFAAKKFIQGIDRALGAL